MNWASKYEQFQDIKTMIAIANLRIFPKEIISDFNLIYDISMPWSAQFFFTTIEIGN